MAILHNQVDNRALKQRLYQETFRRITISFYRYTTIAHPQAFRDELYLKLQALQVFGRIYIATEGINAQISVPEFAFESFKNAMNETEGLQNLRLNIAVDDDGKSFWVLKIKVREKIVADGLADGEINLHQTGRYVDAQAMNALMNAPDTVVVDMRNHYEYEVGHFTGALEVPSDTFREQLPMAAEMLKGKENAPIVMYCTGGIRCEKASAYLRAKGFAQVHHLEGGIINYAKQIAEQNLPSRFVGKNFVFDDRMGERITEDVIAHCHQCGAPCDTHTNCKNDACHLLFIQCSSCSHQFAGCCTADCAQVVKGEAPAALPVPGKAFHKAKERLRPKLGRQIH